MCGCNSHLAIILLKRELRIRIHNFKKDTLTRLQNNKSFPCSKKNLGQMDLNDTHTQTTQ